MKALSIRQPWAWLIIELYKPVENRSRRTHYRGPILIHASKRLDYLDADYFVKGLGLEIDIPVNVPLGGIVGMAEIVDCVESHPSPFFTGPFGYVLANVKPLPFQPCKGQLGFFTPDIDVKAA